MNPLSAGTQYVSKLDEFECFIERIRKYGLVSPSFAGRPSSPVILLIDDLPLTFGRSAYKRLQNCLHLLVQSACTPTVILITDTGHSDSADDTTRGLEELISFLEKAGAYKVSTSNCLFLFLFIYEKYENMLLGLVILSDMKLVKIFRYHLILSQITLSSGLSLEYASKNDAM